MTLCLTASVLWYIGYMQAIAQALSSTTARAHVRHCPQLAQVPGLYLHWHA